jgi:hypothetical protein
VLLEQGWLQPLEQGLRLEPLEQGLWLELVMDIDIPVIV